MNSTAIRFVEGLVRGEEDVLVKIGDRLGRRRSGLIFDFVDDDVLRTKDGLLLSTSAERIRL
jgi:hypothetical protein